MECSICYTDQKMCKLSCNHLFCHSCIKTWYFAGVGDSTCPMCRTSVEFKGSEFVKLMWGINYFLTLDRESKPVKDLLYKKEIYGYRYYILTVFVNIYFWYCITSYYKVNYYYPKYILKTPQLITWITHPLIYQKLVQK